jgi:hypothetical protein
MNELEERNARQRDIDRKHDEGKRGPALCLSVECDFCRLELEKGDGYHRVTLGMNEAPYFVHGPILSESTVESTTEMTVCTRCQPQVTSAFDAFLAALWELRAKDAPPSDDEEPTIRTTVPA